MNENTNIKTPEACNLFDEMLELMRGVAEAKENAKAWNEEARNRMRKVKTLINAQRAIDPEAPEVAAFIEALDKAISEETENTEDTENTEETPSGSYDDVNPEDTNA